MIHTMQIIKSIKSKAVIANIPEQTFLFFFNFSYYGIVYCIDNKAFHTKGLHPVIHTHKTNWDDVCGCERLDRVIKYISSVCYPARRQDCTVGPIKYESP